MTITVLLRRALTHFRVFILSENHPLTHDTSSVTSSRRSSFRSVKSHRLSELVWGGGERQASPNLRGIRSDHIARYRFAAKRIPSGCRVLDIACGVGYGTYLMASVQPDARFIAIDKSSIALKYGRRYYNSNNIFFMMADCIDIGLKASSFEVVTSFETIEHIADDRRFLSGIQRSLSPNGKLFLSTPNEESMPFHSASFPFHVRHYDIEALVKLLTDSNFRVDNVYSQPNRESEEILGNSEGLYFLLECSKIEK